MFSQRAASAFGKMMADSKGVVKGSDIASSQRSPKKNKMLKAILIQIIYMVMPLIFMDRLKLG